MMANDFDRILDECIDRLGRGESLEDCLTAYPEHGKELEPLLRAMLQTIAAYPFTPSVDARREARKRFYAALERKRQPSFWQRVQQRRLVWGTLATVLVVSIIGFVALRTTVFPVEPPSMTIPGPSADGNFAFLVSDEVNAIGDFSRLDVTIDRVGLLKSGDQEKWVEFSPEINKFDLTLLPGDESQELWRGNVPEGSYTKVFIYVTGVQGTLKATPGTVDVKLPGNKLQISQPFQVSAGTFTTFTFDMTVVKTGNAQDGGKYLLKPQIDQSGASHKPIQSKGNGKGQNRQP